MGVTDSWEGKQSFRGERGRTDREWGSVRRTQNDDDEDDYDDDHYEDGYDDGDYEDGDGDDEDEIYLGAGSATSGVVLTNTGAGFLGSGGDAV